MKSLTRFLVFYLFSLVTLHAATLSGQIVDDEGKPVDDASISIPALAQHQHSDASGTFRFTNLAKGVFAIKIHKAGFPSRIATVDLRNGDQDAVFKLETVHMHSDTVVISGYRPIDEADLAQAVTIIEGKRLDKLRGQSLVHTIEETPGVANFSTGNFVAKPVIRGLPSFRSLILVDGMREEAQQFGDEHGPNLDIMDVERIEIVRGPGSLLYGSDALGGVINVATPELPSVANHSRKLSGKITGDAFSNNPGGAGSVALHGAAGDAGYRANFSMRQAGNTRTPDGAVPNSAYKNLNGSALVGISEKWGMLSLRYSRYDAQINLPQSTTDSSGKLIADPDTSTYQKVAHDRVQLRSLVNTGIAKFEIGLSYQQNRRREYESSAAPDPRLNLVLDTVNTEIKAHHAPLGPLLGTLGFSHIHQQNRTIGEEPLIPAYTSNSYGAFIFEELRFDAFSILGGVRGDTRIMNVGDNSALGVSAQNVQNSAATGSLGGVWRFAKGWSLFANVGRGFRAPTAFELFAGGVHEGSGLYETGDRNLKSETSLTTDGGLKLHKHIVRAELNAYMNKVDNYIFSAPTGAIYTDALSGSNYAVYQNRQGNATIYGGEFDAEVSVLKWLTLSGGVDIIAGRNDTLGEPLALIPANRYRTGITFLTDKIGVILNPYLSVKARYVARKSELSSQERTLYSGFADYTVVGASTGGDFAVGGQVWSYTLGADNLLNQRYVDYLSRQKLFALNPGINVYFKITAPIDILD